MTDHSIYAGLDWAEPKTESRTLFEATGLATPHHYRVRTDGDDLGAYAGFPQSPYKSWIRIGLYHDIELALLACERHDFAYAQTAATARSIRLVFVGSKRTQSIAAALSEQNDGNDVLDLLVDTPRVANGRPFHRVASYFDAQKSAMKQNNNGTWALTLTVMAREVPLWLTEASPGSTVALAAVLTTEATEAEEQDWRRQSAEAMKRAHLMPMDPLFMEWMAARHDRWGLIETAIGHQTSEEVQQATGETLKRVLGIPSRKDLLTNRDAVERLTRLTQDFYRDVSAGFAARFPASRP